MPSMLTDHDRRRVLTALINEILRLADCNVTCDYSATPAVIAILKRIVKEQSNGKSGASYGHNSRHGGAGV